MTVKKYFTVYILFNLLFLFHFQNGIAQTANKPATIFEYLAGEEAVKMTLEADMTTLLASRQVDEYYPALLTLADGKSFQVSPTSREAYRICSGRHFSYCREDLTDRRAVHYQ